MSLLLSVSPLSFCLYSDPFCSCSSSTVAISTPYPHLWGERGVSNVPTGGMRELIYCTSPAWLANGPTHPLCPLTPSQKNISTPGAQCQPVSGSDCLPRGMFSPLRLEMLQTERSLRGCVHCPPFVLHCYDTFRTF